MEPRSASQPWPSGETPAPAWTKTIGGGTYTIKRVQGDSFGIWRDVEELGTFELHHGGHDELRASVEHLSLEARAVVDEFIATYQEPFEGAARREAP